VLGHELVLFIDTGGEVKVYDEPTLVHAVGVLLHHTEDGWLVAGFDTAADASPPSPEWPPTTHF
jgi:hypothetical protein